MAEARRDRWGRYLVVPPDGDGRPVGYTRATTVAKELDSQGGLIPWKATATMVGALRRPGLHARWQALHAEHPDPWYATPDSKAACKRLVEECATAGGSTDRADIGTALHALTEQQDRGGAGVPIIQPGMQADLDIYRHTLEVHGITFDRTLIETMVVLDNPGNGERIAGTADRLRMTVPGYGDMVGDLKTGADLKYSWLAIAIQLAEYAHADNIYQQGTQADGSADRRLPMPKLSQTHGLVIHLPAGEATCSLWLVDLVAGWEALQLALALRRFRNRRDLAAPFVGTNPPRGPQPVDDFDAPVPTAAASTVHTTAGVEAAAVDDFDQPMIPAARQRPTIVPPVRNPAPAPAADPARAELLQLRRQLPTNPDEGRTVNLDIEFNRLDELITEHLTPAAGEWLKPINEAAARNGVGFHGSTRTERRYHLCRGLIAMIAGDTLDNDALRALCAIAHGNTIPLHPGIEPGHALGALDVAGAQRFAAAVDDMNTGRLLAYIDDAGTFRLLPAAA